MQVNAKTTPVQANPKAAQDLPRQIKEAEAKSAENTNTNSIYGDQVSIDDAKEWLGNNPMLAKSDRLLKLTDYNANGQLEAGELSRAASRKVVVLNGVKSYHVPGETKSQTAGKVSTAQPAPSSEERYYQAKTKQLEQEQSRQKAKATGAAVGVGLLLLIGAGAAAKKGADEILR